MKAKLRKYEGEGSVNGESTDKKESVENSQKKSEEENDETSAMINQEELDEAKEQFVQVLTENVEVAENENGHVENMDLDLPAKEDSYEKINPNEETEQQEKQTTELI